MANAKLTVTLDANGVPSKFDFSPPTLNIYNSETIYWSRGSSNFAFAAIAFAEQNPFQNIVVSDTQITADDNYNGSEEHKYSVLIKVGHNYFSSRTGGIGNGGPTIRNN
jgi:hypothetical protein